MSSTPDVPRELFEHAAFVRRLARSLLADAQAAEDAEQETWRAALERPPRADMRAWLGRVTRNFALRHRRSEGRRAEREELSARDAHGHGPEELLAREESLRLVTHAVSSLDEPYRSTVLARYYEDLPARAIARRDGVPVETVRTRLKRAHGLLRARLGERGADWRGSLGLFLARHPEPPWSSMGPATWMSVMKAKTWMLVAAGALGLVAALGVSSLLAEGPPPGPDEALASQPADHPSAEPGEVRPADEVAARSAVSVTAHAAGLSGRVVDEHGAGVARASIFVLGVDDPFPAGHPAPEVRAGKWRGRTFISDAEGRWSGRLDAPARVLVALGPDVGFEPLGPREERWVETPAAGIDFTVRRVATATLLVRALDGATREPLRDFRITVRGAATVLPGGVTSYAGYWARGAVDGLVREELPAHDPAGTQRSVLLYLPGAEEALLEQELVLYPGETRELVFVVPERGVVQGFVVDPAGRPIAGALVFLGAETRARGDEPFRLFREERVPDGVRTAADGWFELPGKSDAVTAWHAGHSPATVPAAQAGRIVLAPRGALRGRLLDAGRAPVAGVVLALDEPRAGPRAVTGADGGFAFEGLEGGAHALWGKDGELLACVRLAAGEELALELLPPPPEPVLLELRGAAGELDGLVAGLEQVFTLQEIAAEDARLPIELAGALPEGRYWLVTRQGIAAGFTHAAGSARAVVQAGEAVLLVSAPASTSVQVVPAGADPFVRLCAARVRVRPQPGAPARFRLAPGSYLVVGEAGRVLSAVDVGAAGAQIAVD